MTTPTPPEVTQEHMPRKTGASTIRTAVSDDCDYFKHKYTGQSYPFQAKQNELHPMIYDFFVMIDTDKTGELSTDNLEEAADIIRIAKTAKTNNAAELNYKHMSPAVAEVLSQWDADNSGSVGISELIMAAEAQKKMAKENR